MTRWMSGKRLGVSHYFTLWVLYRDMIKIEKMKLEEEKEWFVQCLIVILAYSPHGSEVKKMKLSY